MMKHPFPWAISVGFLIAAELSLTLDTSRVRGKTPKTAYENANMVAADWPKGSVVIQEAEDFTLEIITTTISVLGGALSAYLGILVRRLDRVNKAVITGVEICKEKNVKRAISNQAKLMGVENVLHQRVKKLTK